MREAQGAGGLFLLRRSHADPMVKRPEECHLQEKQSGEELGAGEERPQLNRRRRVEQPKGERRSATTAFPESSDLRMIGSGNRMWRGPFGCQWSYHRET